ncbi:MAG: HDOD domain-containing protein [Planctomycetes bacterium]|nr:HDOD domain-containing protein [Planctomycetota bacterium]
MGWFGSLLERFAGRRTLVGRVEPRLPLPPAAGGLIVDPITPAKSPVVARPRHAPADSAAPREGPTGAAGDDAHAEAERRRQRERAQLLASFRATIVDPRFQENEVDARFVDELGSFLGRSTESFAMPPAAAFDVMRLIDDRGYQVRKVSAAISCDPTLAGAVLSLANSPLHRGDVDVDSVPSAVVRLGQRHLKLLLLDIALHSTKVRGRPFEPFSAALWKHSLLTAQLAHQLAQRTQLDPDQAYMAGLFHDIGSFAVIAAARRLALRQDRKLSPQTLLACQRRHGYALNGTIVARWRLPAAVARAVSCRRRPEEAQSESRLAAVTELANDLSRPLGAWVETRAIDWGAHRLVEALRLDPAVLPSEAAILELAQRVEKVGTLG